MPPTYLSVAEAATELDRSPRTVLRLIQRGDLAAIQIGGGKTSAYAISRDELERFKAA